MTVLATKSSHNMATNNGLRTSQPQYNQPFYSPTTSYTNNNNNGIENMGTPIVPYDQFIKSGYNEFEVWLRCCDPHKLTYSVSHYSSMDFEQQQIFYLWKNFIQLMKHYNICIIVCVRK